MFSCQEYYHIATKRKFEVGQKLNFNEGTSNRLYEFFFQTEFRNRDGKDIYQIFKAGFNGEGLELTKEDSIVFLKYNDNTIRGIRELIVEMVRLKYYPNYPSRLNCLYASRSYEDILKWKKIFDSYNRSIVQIVKLKSNGRYFEGDGNLLPKEDAISFDKKISQAIRYWESNTEIELPEVLIDGEIEVIEIIDEY